MLFTLVLRMLIVISTSSKFFFLGEPLKIQEAFAYMRFLVGFNENLDEIYNERNEKKSASIDFTFLPEVYLTIKISLNFSYIMS